MIAHNLYTWAAIGEKMPNSIPSKKATSGIRRLKSIVRKSKFTDNTATVYSRIHLNSEVGGNAVRFPFIVTEVYVRENGKWLMTSLIFTKTLGD